MLLLVAAVTVVVELFTAEGCSSCPPADRLLEQLAAADAIDGVKIVVLGEHVDYWDQLGWRDRFSSAAFTARQQVYTRRFNDDSAYTPQLVVDGRAGLVGSDAAAARRAVAKAAAAPHGTMTLVARPFPASARGEDERAPSRERPAAPVSISVNFENLPVGRGDHPDILVAVTEDGLRSNVKSGENRGRVLTHAAVVRRLTTIGEAAGPTGSAQATIDLSPDWQRDALNIVAFVQQRRDRGILAAASVRPIERP